MLVWSGQGVVCVNTDYDRRIYLEIFIVFTLIYSGDSGSLHHSLALWHMLDKDKGMSRKRPSKVAVRIRPRFWSFCSSSRTTGERMAGRVLVSYIGWPIGDLTHWGRDKMDAISQTTFSSAFSWMKLFEFRSKFKWSLFLRVRLTVFQHWFRYWLGQATGNYLNQWWLVYRPIHASLGLNELTQQPHISGDYISSIYFHILIDIVSQVITY